MRYPNADALKAMLRTGVRPDSSSVNAVMPFSSLGKISDMEVEALYAFIKTMRPRAARNR